MGKGEYVTVGVLKGPDVGVALGKAEGRKVPEGEVTRNFSIGEARSS